MSLGVFSNFENPTSTNISIITRNISEIFNNNGIPFENLPTNGKYCTDLHDRRIPPGVHYVPGPDHCTLCVCDQGEAKWCKSVLCSPPMDCKSFRVGSSCCDFICLDDSNVRKTFDLSDVQEFVPKVVIVALTAMLSLSLLFFLVHRLRQRQLQTRMNTTENQNHRSPSCEDCEGCDDTRSLDYSYDGFVPRLHIGDRGRNNNYFTDPQYFTWLKPPNSYFSQNSEAPPPYDEAIASNSNFVQIPEMQVTYTPQPCNTQTNSNATNPANAVESEEMSSTTTAAVDNVVVVNSQTSNNTETDNPLQANSQSNESQRVQEPEEPIPGPSSMSRINVIERSENWVGYPPPAYQKKSPKNRHSFTLPNHNDNRSIIVNDPTSGAQLIFPCSNHQIRNPQQRFSLQINVADWNDNDSSSSLSTATPTPSTPSGLENNNLNQNAQGINSQQTHHHDSSLSSSSSSIISNN